MSFDTGAKLMRVSGGPVSFYLRYNTTTLYAEKVFGGGVNTITITNDATGTTEKALISFDGATLAGEVGPGESMTLETKTRPSVWIRGTAGGSDVRVWGW